MKKVHRDSR